MSDSTLSHDDGTFRLSRMASPGYGIVYGLALGLSTWGYDTWVLARSNAELAWAKPGIGLPLLLFICATAGAMAGRSNRVGVWVRTWMASGILIGIVVGEMPFAGHTLATWIAEPGLLGVNVYPIDPAGAARMAFTAVVTSGVGSAAGLVGHLLTERVQAPASPAVQMSGRRFSGALLVLCMPLAVLPGLIGDEIINKPLRIGQKTVHKVISMDAAEGANHGDMNPYRDQFSARYVLHLVDYDLEMQERGTIDVTFNSGFAMRCQVSGYGLDGCLPISPKFEAWMDGLIQEGLKGGQGTELAHQAGHVSVDEHTLSWLASQREHISDRYEISRDTQHGGWVIMSAHFDTGYVLTCYFFGDSPVTLDRCSGDQET